ncbi:hypothetical protein B0T19DRAFT_385293 [Cercophora scortea]|uniref:C2H2-type domain-containing protein n=1 Tax=Cercophora scortea TaxID=314031 RepID=A0AAE0IPC7_9PEZI|nr:hypothetical protein B0T19DRAFT_385293 [Cercophora scortea]
MSYEILKLPRCACSAYFLTEDGLREHLEEYRSREQHLQAEAEICRAHSRVDDDRSDQSDYDDNQYNEDNDIGNHTSTRRNDGSHGGHYCPDPTYVPCEEVCVCCFKMFRHTSKFLRHAKKHADIGGRKMTFIKSTCDDLCEHSNTQLDLALSQGLSAVVRSKKRKLGMAALDSEASGIQDAIIDDQPQLQGSSEPLHSGPTDAESSVQTRHRTRSPTALPPPNMVGTTGTYAGMSYPMEAQPQPDLLRTFDAPVLHIMNGVPTWMDAWTTGNHETVNPANEVLEASGTQDVIVADHLHLQGSSQAQLDLLGTFDAPILQIMNGVLAWGADNHETVNQTSDLLAYHDP